MYLFQYQDKENLYINLSRNIYQKPEYTEIIRQIVAGRQILVRESEHESETKTKIKQKKNRLLHKD